MLELHDLRPEWRSGWDNLVVTHAGAMLFHRPDWLQILQRTQHLDLLPLGIVQGGQMVGVLPLFVKRYGPLRIGASPFVVEDTPYLGPVVDQYPLGAVLDALDAWARRAGLAFVRLLLPPHAHGSAAIGSVAPNSRMTVVEKHTHILDLTRGADRLWQDLKHGCRGAIKKAQRAGLEIVPATASSDVCDYYAIADALYRAQGRRHPNPPELFQQLWARFSPSKEVSLLLAHHDGRPVGGVFLAHANGTVHYLDGASDATGKRLQAVNLLLWHAVLQALDTGATHFDFVGSDIPRLAQFKASFGGTLHPYWCIEIEYSHLAGILRRFYPRWKALVARVSR
jgi:CelD/BcsL family acetyltransferase involved in cellulose biosynthesis